jgi:hypothetical protein
LECLGITRMRAALHPSEPREALKCFNAFRDKHFVRYYNIHITESLHVTYTDTDRS